MWKFLYFLGWLLIGAVSLYGVFIGIAPEQLDNVNFYESNTRIAIVTGSLFLFILFIKKAAVIFESAETKIVVKHTEAGEIAVSLSAVEAIAGAIIQKKEMVKEYKIKSLQKNKELFLNIETSLGTSTEVLSVIETLQEEIIATVEEIMGIKIKQIKINVAKLTVLEKEAV